MAMWSVWSEGYVVTGQTAGAMYHGRWLGETFAEACQNWANSLHPSHRHYFDPEKLSFWGCRLYNNETDARRSFG